MTSQVLAGCHMLCFAPRLWPVWGAGTQRTTAFLLGFARAGAVVTARVVVPEPTSHRPLKLSPLNIEQVVDPLARIPWQLKHAAMCAGLSDGLSPGYRRSRQMAHRRVDVVFASGPPWSAVREAARVASKLNAPLIVDMRDEWSANPFQTKLGPLFHWLNRRRERSALQCTMAFSAPYPGVLATLAGPHEAKTRVIAHGCELDLICSTVGPPPVRQQGEPLRLLFAGARYGMINEDAFLLALGAIPQDECIDFRLVGASRPVRAPVPEHALVSTRANVSHESLMTEYAEAHALLTLGPERRGLGWIPSKIPEYLATGRPILGFGAAGSRLQSDLASAPGTVFVDEAEPLSLRAGLAELVALVATSTDFRPQRSLRSWDDVGDEAAAFAAAVTRT